MKTQFSCAVGLALGLVFANVQASPPDHRHDFDSFPGNGVGNSEQPRDVGKYLLADDHVNVFGGALLRDDCTHDGGLMGAVMVGPPYNRQLSVIKLIPTFWVNNPDPTTLPAGYATFAVPDALANMARLFLCYNVVPISGANPGMTTFCDWAPRDLREPFSVTTDGVRTMLMDVEYRGGRGLCAEDENTWVAN
ncbi:hypothetical protein [Chromatium okenii]|uniref:Uncharacterized protein n=1 Tax=Chromatium okenii TaxID=61644 RepID=A0A2S7XNR7_9GAMM|nr:hypothetical protein [Chromatium okenii]MBV5308832.1 hypothetical protein [Chromatium okenii]PQJ95379.1 hypothetical protein CXB77_14260 [Chromatium okenii]PQJ97611.1 hypothetical protein CXB77_00610 [Chromatium okenii]